MGMENGGYATRGVAFFDLFDWNRKSRRKLSTNGIAFQEETKHQGRKDRVLPEIELRPNDSVDDVDGRGGESASPTRGGNSGLSVAGDDSSTAVKAPGVVARLMGLDFLPKSGTVESSCTPSVEPEDACCRKERLDREFSCRISGASSGNELCSCRPSGLANGPVESFQTETLRPWNKSVKSPFPVRHKKLLSPVKKAHHISSGNAAAMVEAAAKILDASRHGNSSSSCPPKASWNPSLRVCDKSECSAASARQSRPLRSSLVCSNGMEPRLRGSSAWNGSNSGGAKGKGKAASLFPQYGRNIRVKLGSSVGQNGIVSDQPHKRSNSQKRVDRKDSSANSSIVLKQNNQKQNTLGNRDMLPGKFGGSRHLHEKSLSRSRKGASSVKSNPGNKLPAASVTCSAKECQVVGGSAKGKPASKIGTYTRQEKVRDSVKISRNRQLTESTFANKTEKRIQHVVIADHKQKSNEDGRRDIADVVSFTFTSPVLISTSADISPARRMEKEEGGSCSSLDGLWKGNITDAKDTATSTVDIKEMNGDDIGRLLEQKLRALTSELESSQDNLSTSQDSLIAPRTKACVTEFAHVINPGSAEDFFGPLSNRGSPSIGFNEMSGGQNKEEATSMTKVSSDSMGGPDPLQPNPSSILEACFSDVNYEPSATFSSNGTSLDSSVQIEQQAAPILLEDKPSPKTEMESISSSPPFVQIVDEESEDIPRWCRKNNPQPREWEISYVREILTASELHYRDLMLGCDVGDLDPLIFSHLEHQRNNIPDDGNKGAARWSRKFLFDCVSECLSLIPTLNLHAEFRSCFWTNAKMMVPNELAEKIYDEISTWGSLGARKVDEHVEKDVNNYPRRWIDFEADLFEIRSQIEEKVLTNLIDEIAVQFLD